MALSLFVNFESDELQDAQGSQVLIDQLSIIEDYCEERNLPLFEDFSAHPVSTDPNQSADHLSDDPEAALDYFREISVVWHDPATVFNAIDALYRMLSADMPSQLTSKAPALLNDLDRLRTLLKAAVAHEVRVHLEVS